MLCCCWWWWQWWWRWWLDSGFPLLLLLLLLLMLSRCFYIVAVDDAAFVCLFFCLFVTLLIALSRTGNVYKPSFQYKIQSLTFSIFPRRTFIYLFIFKQTDGIGLFIEYLLLLRESIPPAKQSSCNYQGLVVRRPISA